MGSRERGLLLAILFLILLPVVVFAEEIIISEDMVLDEPIIIGDNQHITLIPAKGNRTITRGSGLIESPLFWVQGENASLTLGKPDVEYQLTIDGGYLNTPSIQAHAPLAAVSGLDSKLIMYDNVTLQNNCNNGAPSSGSMYQNGAGVLVCSIDDLHGQEPEFIMKGGIIRGNINDVHNPYPNGGAVLVRAHGIFTMEGGSIINNTARTVGGGVFLEGTGTFIKTGGIIYGKNAQEGYRNIAVDGYGRFHGHALYVSVSEGHLQRYRDDTITENETLNYTGAPSRHGVFGTGEKWHHANTVLHRTLLIIIAAIIMIGVPLAFIARRKHNAKQAAVIRAAVAAAQEATAANTIEPEVDLSPREREIFNQLFTELSTKEIAHNLKLSYSGVDYHIKNLYAKLAVQDRMELVFKYTKK